MNLRTPTPTLDARRVLPLFLVMAALVVAINPARAQYLSGAGAGPTNPNRVRVHDGAGALKVDITAYAAGGYGANVAAAHLQYGGYDTVLTGPGPGARFGPQVRGFDNRGNSVPGLSFYGYGTLRYGVKTAGARLKRDELEQFLTTPGPGAVFGPHVRGYEFVGNQVQRLNISFYAYLTLRFGANATGSDLDDDAFDEIVTGAGPGAVFSPHVRGFNYDGAAIKEMPKVSFNALNATTYGANVAGGDADGDQRGDMLAALGPGPQHAASFRGFTFAGGSVAALPGYAITPFSTLYGGRVACGRASTWQREDLMAGRGPDPTAPAGIATFTYTGSGLSAGFEFDPFPTLSYGVNPGFGSFGY